MSQCWYEDPSHRATFTSIREQLENLLGQNCNYLILDGLDYPSTNRDGLDRASACLNEVDYLSPHCDELHFPSPPQHDEQLGHPSTRPNELDREPNTCDGLNRISSHPRRLDRPSSLHVGLDSAATVNLSNLDNSSILHDVLFSHPFVRPETLEHSRTMCSFDCSVVPPQNFESVASIVDDVMTLSPLLDVTCQAQTNQKHNVIK